MNCIPLTTSRLGFAAAAMALLVGAVDSRAAFTFTPPSVFFGPDVPPPDAGSPWIGGPESKTLPQFNPTLVGDPNAVLLGVELTFISVLALDNLGLENTSPVPADITVSQVLNTAFTYPTPVTAPLTSPVNQAPEVGFVASFPLFDGTDDKAGTSGRTYVLPGDAALLVNTKTTVITVNPSDWGAYEGAGDFTVSFDALLGAFNSSTEDGKTFTFLEPDALAQGEVKVTFHYDIPETSTAAAGAGLVLLVGVAGWRMRRRS